MKNKFVKIPITLTTIDPQFNMHGSNQFIVDLNPEKKTVSILTSKWIDGKMIEQSFAELNQLIKRNALWFGHYTDEELRTAKEF